MQSTSIDSFVDYLYSYMTGGVVVKPSASPLQAPPHMIAHKRIIRDEWHFENGTVVIGPCTLSESREKMLNTAHSMKTFYASQLLEGLYEVQFTDDLHPSVVVIVEADTGMQAGRLARHMLATDYAYCNVLTAE